MARGLRESPRARRGSARWVQRLTKRPPSASRLFLCDAVVTLGQLETEVELVNWWVVLGVGPPAAPAVLAVLAVSPLAPNLATREENVYFFPFSASLLFFYFGKPRFFTCVRVTAAGGRGSRLPARPASSRARLCVPVLSVKWA